jgi:hypothetical protein
MKAAIRWTQRTLAIAEKNAGVNRRVKFRYGERSTFCPANGAPAMPIPKVSARIRNFLFSLGATSIAVTAKGAVVITANPSGLEVAWWLRRDDAELLRAACFVKGDVEAAARRLGIALTPHDVACMRADHRLAMLDQIIETARTSGDLQSFNRTYQRLRIRAASKGQRFMSYGTAQEKLRRQLVTAIGDGEARRPFSFSAAMARVFDQ